MPPFESLTAEQTYQACDSTQFTFRSTDELEALDFPLGQDRAREAIEFGVDIPQDGFNLYVMGPPGVGKLEVVNKVLTAHASQSTSPPDWCYVNNFNRPQQPNLLRLPAGLGRTLQQDMKQLVEDLLAAIPSTFQSDEYHNRRQEIENDSRQRYEAAFKSLDAEAREKGIALIRTPSGYTLAPMVDNEAISPEDFEKLPREEQQKIEKKVEEIQQKLQEILRSMPIMTREFATQLKDLNKEFTESTIEQFIALLETKYREQPGILAYLEQVKEFAINNVQDFLPNDKSSDMQHLKQRVEEFPMYAVNVFVDSTQASGAAVVFEDNPTYQNLVGRVEYRSQMGTLVTDFTLIKSGALHRANGGYLILEAQKLLSNLYAWEGLKRALKSHEIKIASLQQALSLESTISLEPESVPLEIKIVLTGEPLLYYLLNQYDPEFGQLFKIAADFAYQADRNPASSELFVRMLATQQQQHRLRALAPPAVARVVEQASRLAGDNQKLSLHIEGINDLLKEAHYWAGKDGSDLIEYRHVELTLEKQVKRKNRIQELLRENILRGINLIATQGSVVGQINGLSVLQMSNYAFGTPTRITATARLGQGRVMDVEREVKMGGDIHSKGVLILTSYFASRYARDNPLPLSASLVFEQSYGGVDGDSATAAELCVLLSAVGDIPLNQSLAVTGSMNQHGEIQAIGGVNEKIEGFFDICQQRGFTGEQGVIIPASNQVHLMLRQDVREAISAGQFHVYTAQIVDDVMALLSGLEPGSPDTSGQFPPESFNGKVQQRITDLQKLHQQFSRNHQDDTDGEKDV
jgi:predicted ATP-dependent protease